MSPSAPPLPRPQPCLVSAPGPGLARHTACGLVQLNGLKEGLEVAGAKALVVVALDQLDKERGPVLHRLDEERDQKKR